MVSPVGNYVPLLAVVEKPTLCWFGHNTRHNSLAKTILQGKAEDKIQQGQSKLNWIHTILNLHQRILMNYF